MGITGYIAIINNTYADNSDCTQLGDYIVCDFDSEGDVSVLYVGGYTYDNIQFGYQGNSNKTYGFKTVEPNIEVISVVGANLSYYSTLTNVPVIGAGTFFSSVFEPLTHYPGQTSSFSRLGPQNFTDAQAKKAAENAAKIAELLIVVIAEKGISGDSKRRLLEYASSLKRFASIAGIGADATLAYLDKDADAITIAALKFAATAVTGIAITAVGAPVIAGTLAGLAVGIVTDAAVEKLYYSAKAQLIIIEGEYREALQNVGNHCKSARRGACRGYIPPIIIDMESDGINFTMTWSTYFGQPS